MFKHVIVYYICMLLCTVTQNSVYAYTVKHVVEFHEGSSFHDYKGIVSGVTQNTVTISQFISW